MKRSVQYGFLIISLVAITVLLLGLWPKVLTVNYADKLENGNHREISSAIIGLRKMGPGGRQFLVSELREIFSGSDLNQKIKIIDVVLEIDKKELGLLHKTWPDRSTTAITLISEIWELPEKPGGNMIPFYHYLVENRYIFTLEIILEKTRGRYVNSLINGKTALDRAENPAVRKLLKKYGGRSAKELTETPRVSYPITAE